MQRKFYRKSNTIYKKIIFFILVLACLILSSCRSGENFTFYIYRPTSSRDEREFYRILATKQIQKAIDFLKENNGYSLDQSVTTFSTTSDGYHELSL